MRIHIFILIWLLGCLPLTMAKQPNFDFYEAEDGLSMNTVNDIVTDNDGFLWAATQAGLNRFDGKKFKVYNVSNNQYGPSGKHITRLFYGRKKQLWLLTKNDGINQYHPAHDTFSAYHHLNSPLPDTEFTDLSQDSDGNIWLATKADGLIHYSPTDNKIINRFTDNSQENVQEKSQTNKLISNGITRLFTDKFERLWIISDRGLSLMTSELTLTHFPHDNTLIKEEITSVESGQSNTLWIGTKSKGLFLLDIHTSSFKRIDTAIGLEGNRITSLKKDRLGKLWIGLEKKGLARYSPQHKTIEFFSGAAKNRQQLNSSLVTSMTIDSDHQLWIGTKGGGLNKTFLDAETFGHMHPQSFADNHLKNGNVRSIFRDHRQQLWVGTAKGLYRALEDKNKQIIGFKPFMVPGSRLSQSFISFMREDKQNQFWVGTRGEGLFIFTADKQSYIHYKHNPANSNGLPSDLLFSLYFDRDNSAWITTMDAGVAKYISEARGFSHFRHDKNNADSLASNEITNLIQDKEGNYWFTSYNAGLTRLSVDGTFTRFNTDTLTGFPDDQLMSVFMGKNDTLWLGSSNGIFSFNSRTHDTQLFNTDKGLIGNLAYLTLMDNKQNLWVGTASGLSMFNTHDFSVKNYTNIDGLQDNEFNFGAGFIDDDNRIYLGGINGFNQFRPNQLPTLHPPREPRIDTISILNKNQSSEMRHIDRSIPEESQLSLSHHDDIFSLYYLSPELHRANRLTYEYKMIGLHDKWISGHPDQVARFTGIASGNYTFLLRAKDINGQYSPVRQLDIQILPTPWLSWWAYCLYITGVISLLFLLLYSKSKKYRQQSRLLTEIEKSEQRLQLALWGSGDEFWDWDIDNREVIRSNTFLKYPDTETHLDDTMKQCIHPDDYDEIAAEIDHCMNRGQDKFKLMYRSILGDGTWLWVLNRGQVITRDQLGQPTRIAGTIKNIQAQKDNEASLTALNLDLEARVQGRTSELQHKNDELKETLEELKQTQSELLDKEKMATLGGLVASITHEVNTPIGISVTAASHLQTSVQLFNKHYADGEVSHEDFEEYQTEVHDCSKLILTNLERASKLIKSFKQVSVDQSHEEIREFNLKTYLDEIFLSLNPMLSRTVHEYEYTCPDDLFIKSNPGAFYQIVSNLFNNSVIHAFHDGHSGHLSLHIIKTDHGVDLTYRDDGCGIPTQVQDKIFDPFFTTKRGKGGSGLGMNIVYNLVTQMLGGEITLHSEKDKGCQFTISLPKSILVNSK